MTAADQRKALDRLAGSYRRLLSRPESTRRELPEGEPAPEPANPLAPATELLERDDDATGG